MKLRYLICAAVILTGLFDPSETEARRRRPLLFRNRIHRCHRCLPPRMYCGCPFHVCPCSTYVPHTIAPMAPMQPGCVPCQSAVPTVQTQMVPVTQTTLEPRQVVQYETVPQIQYQRQAYTETVPVTNYKTVTVDKGSYQLVWVPRPVQVQVPYTTYTQQTRYRDVAVQVNQQVARTYTQFVPQQTVQYVPQTQVAVHSPVGIAWQQPVYTTVPQTVSLPTFTLPGEPTVRQAAAPIHRPAPSPEHLQLPDAQPSRSAAADDWTTIRQRGAAQPDPQSSYNPPTARGAGGAPSAATVWQSQLENLAVVR